MKSAVIIGQDHRLTVVRAGDKLSQLGDAKFRTRSPVCSNSLSTPKLAPGASTSIEDDAQTIKAYYFFQGAIFKTSGGAVFKR